MGAVFDLVALFSGDFSSPSYSRDNGDGTVSTLTTRMREEARETTYPVTEHIENFELELNLSGEFGETSISVPYSSKDRLATVEHNNNMPQMDLHPERANLTGQARWFDAHVEPLAAEFASHLKESWAQRYCDNSTESVEAVFRCIKVGPRALPNSLRKWFEVHIGLTPKQTNELVGGLY